MECCFALCGLPPEAIPQSQRYRPTRRFATPSPSRGGIKQRVPLSPVGRITGLLLIWVCGVDSGEELGLSEEQRAVRTRLAAMREEHRALDETIAGIHADSNADTLQIARLKKRKLALKDEISWLEDQLMPDIIA